MSPTFRAPRALFRMDAITVRRSSGTVDAEGNPASRATVLTGRGTLSTAGPREQELAAQRGSRIDKILSLELGLDVRAGDWVTVNDGQTFEVVAVEDRRVFRRASVRVITA